MKKRINQGTVEDIIEDLVNLQYNVAGIDKNFAYAEKNPDWYNEDFIDKEKYFKEFKPLAISVIRKGLKVNEYAAEGHFSWFTISYSLKFKKDEEKM